MDAMLVYCEGPLEEGWEVLFPGILTADDVADETRRLITDGDVEVDHVPLRPHTHMWCERNGFDAVDSDGEWHTHFEQCAGEPNYTVARVLEERAP